MVRNRRPVQHDRACTVAVINFQLMMELQKVMDTVELELVMVWMISGMVSEMCVVELKGM
jgi:hypothetical protein